MKNNISAVKIEPLDKASASYLPETAKLLQHFSYLIES